MALKIRVGTRVSVLTQVEIYNDHIKSGLEFKKKDKTNSGLELKKKKLSISTLILMSVAKPMKFSVYHFIWKIFKSQIYNKQSMASQIPFLV